MSKQAIILAGGLGTRLRSVVQDIPKCMAPVNGIPFIHFIVSWLKNEGVEDFIFSLGYKHEVIVAYLESSFPQLNKKYSIETGPLGTGGAIKKACSMVTGNQVLVINGDTLFNIDTSSLLNTHIKKNATCSIALKQMKQFSRYGAVELDSQGRITAFHEKRYCEKGWINGGIYVIEVAAFLSKQLPPVFSFEKDYLEKYITTELIIGEPEDYYFIDIGIPEDYQKFSDDYKLVLSKYKYQQEDSPGAVVFFLELLTSIITE